MAGTAKKEGDAAEFVESGEIKKEDEVTFRLTEERRKRLELVGFLWSSKEYVEKAGTAAPKVTRNSYDSQWDMMYERLLGFKVGKLVALFPSVDRSSFLMLFCRIPTSIANRRDMVIALYRRDTKRTPS